MGGIAVMAVGALASFAASAITNKKSNKQMEQLAAARATGPSFMEMPRPPAAPSILKAGDLNQDNTESAAARDKERRLAALRQQENPLNVTGGLGVSGNANLSKKTLLGG